MVISVTVLTSFDTELAHNSFEIVTERVARTLFASRTARL
ncbi:hypothetical protein FTUN_3281 [Frigoriglobus tundricola]|uniref:Uncharacterized protein n=1 Tax=Frigoriglobus tundricola TaxID=2774151 RepID=A0A6M5YNT1_9BACT|nr:hypothetical protein FTUN_3281 [Frigoriglobus tundricola]